MYYFQLHTDVQGRIYISARQAYSLEHGCRTYGTRAHHGTLKEFPNMQHSLLSHVLISFARPPSPHCAQYIQMCDSVQTVYQLPLPPNNTAVKYFYINLSGTKCSLDMYRCGAGLTVTGQIRHIGHNVLLSAFEQ
jgi:hypothetical protein